MIIINSGITILMILAGFTRGFHEGMIMVMPWDELSTNQNYPGVRSHRWFSRYHLVSVGQTAIMLLLGAAIYRWFGSIDWLMFAGATLLLWEASEIGYSVARSGKLFHMVAGQLRENINLADIVTLEISQTIVLILHGLRTLIGLSLIITGGLV